MEELWDYAVLSSNKEFFVSIANEMGLQKFHLMAGAMIKFQGDVETKNKDMIRVKIFNEVDKGKFNQENFLVYCTWEDVFVVSKTIWEMAIAIQDRQRRLRFVFTARSSNAARLVSQIPNNEQFIIKGYDHIVNGMFVCSLYEAQRLLGRPGLYFIVKILVILIYNFLLQSAVLKLIFKSFMSLKFNLKIFFSAMSAR